MPTITGAWGRHNGMQACMDLLRLHAAQALYLSRQKEKWCLIDWLT
jgi:hypothetical protein